MSISPARSGAGASSGLAACRGARGSASVAISTMISMPNPGSMASIRAQRSGVSGCGSCTGHASPTRTV
ncbi:hypothetical protein [Paracoccus sp. MC1854]|uniref:hypothetical protein n=1 Tax=Paracoccus sp. MC1854 TaxID=2760306 RepID=UPI00210375B2|nr:hypothetical protein [Paracoccus sp. MC1854]